MAYKQAKGFARRPVYRSTATRRVAQIAAAAVAFALCAGLQACTSDPTWPSMAKVSDLTNILTPEERQKAVQDLQKSDQGQNSNASATTVKPAQQ